MTPGGHELESQKQNKSGGANKDTPLPEGYRVTELGPLPEEWRVVRLGEVARVCYGKAKPRTNGTVPVIGSGGIYAWTAKPLVNFPTLIIGRKGTAGRVWLAEERCWPSDTTFYLEWKWLVEVRFLHGYFLFNPLSGEHAKTTLPSLQRPDLEKYPIPLPPLPEQLAIAHVLRAVQRAKEATEGVIAALRELKKSLMEHLFTYGPVPVNATGKVELQETEVGLLPKHWRVERLGEVTQKTGQIDPRKKPDWEFKYIDVSSVSNELMAIVDYKIYRGTEAASRARKQVKCGDVIFATVRPYLKRVAKVPPEIDGQICSTAFCILRPKSDLIDENYLFFSVSRDDFVARVSEHQRGSSYPAVTDNDVLRESIPLPPLPEQHEIARILQTVDRKIEAEQQRKATLETLFKTLLHDLMTAKRRLPAEFVAQFEKESEVTS